MNIRNVHLCNLLFWSQLFGHMARLMVPVCRSHVQEETGRYQQKLADIKEREKIFKNYIREP